MRSNNEGKTQKMTTRQLGKVRRKEASSKRHNKCKIQELRLNMGPDEIENNCLGEYRVQREKWWEMRLKSQSKRIFEQILGSLGFMIRQWKVIERVQAIIRFMCY